MFQFYVYTAEKSSTSAVSDEVLLYLLHGFINAVLPDHLNTIDFG
jgi:hypothetical protein